MYCDGNCFKKLVSDGLAQALEHGSILTGSCMRNIFSDSSNNSSPPTPPDLSTSSLPLTPTPSPASPQFPPMIDVDQQTDSNSDTALTLAAAGGHDELVTLLLVKGSDIEHRDKKGTYRMHGQNNYQRIKIRDH